jgi:hypothetical protein
MTIAKQIAEAMDGAPIYETRPRVSLMAQSIGWMSEKAGHGRVDASQRTKQALVSPQTNEGGSGHIENAGLAAVSVRCPRIESLSLKPGEHCMRKRRDMRLASVKLIKKGYKDTHTAGSIGEFWTGAWSVRKSDKRKT